MGSAILLGMAIMSLVLFLWLGFAVFTYVFESLGYYTLAKNRGLDHAWIAWIPIANSYLLGELTGNKMWNVEGSKWILPFGYLLVLLLNLSGVGMVIGVPMMLAYIVYYYMCLFKLFKLYKPESAELYIITSIIFNFMSSIWLFVIRNNVPVANLIEEKETVQEKMYDNIYGDIDSNQGYEIPDHLQEVTIKTEPIAYQSVRDALLDLNKPVDSVSSEDIFNDSTSTEEVTISAMKNEEAEEIDEKINSLTSSLESYIGSYQDSDSIEGLSESSDIGNEEQPIELRFGDTVITEEDIDE